MSIVINIYYHGENGSARAFAREMEESGTAALIRNEPGNQKYEYFYPADDAETVLLIDKWKSQQALDLHHASEMMSTIAALREKYALTMTAERYVTDEGGFSHNDLKYIKK